MQHKINGAIDKIAWYLGAETPTDLYGYRDTYDTDLFSAYLTQLVYTLDRRGMYAAAQLVESINNKEFVL